MDFHFYIENHFRLILEDDCGDQHRVFVDFLGDYLSSTHRSPEEIVIQGRDDFRAGPGGIVLFTIAIFQNLKR
jgi:hypothetical protein